MGQSIDCQPHFGHQVGRRKASYTNYVAQVGEKMAVCLLSDRLLDETKMKTSPFSSSSHFEVLKYRAQRHESLSWLV